MSTDRKILINKVKCLRLRTVLSLFVVALNGQGKIWYAQADTGCWSKLASTDLLLIPSKRWLASHNWATMVTWASQHAHIMSLLRIGERWCVARWCEFRTDEIDHRIFLTWLFAHTSISLEYVLYLVLSLFNRHLSLFDSLSRTFDEAFPPMIFVPLSSINIFRQVS